MFGPWYNIRGEIESKARQVGFHYEEKVHQVNGNRISNGK